MERFSRTRDKLDKLPFLSENSNKFQMYQQKPGAVCKKEKMYDVCKKEKMYDRPAEPMDKLDKLPFLSENSNKFQMYQQKPGAVCKKEKIYDRPVKPMDKLDKLRFLSENSNKFQMYQQKPGAICKKEKMYDRPAEPMDKLDKLRFLSENSNKFQMYQQKPGAVCKKEKMYDRPAEPMERVSKCYNKSTYNLHEEPFYETTIKELDFKGLQGKAVQLSKRETAFTNRKASVNTSAPGSEKKYKLPPIPPAVKKPPAYVKHAENMDLSSTSQNACKLPKIQHTGSNQVKCLTTAEPFNAGSTLNEVLKVWSYKRPVLMEKKGTIPANPLQKQIPFKLVLVPQPPLYLEKTF